jgi:phosphoribosyl 1,2-cyclic phosphodiesterase
MDIRFWGVRGSIPVSGEGFNRVGGSTSCVELSCEGERLILDGGTGLRALGAHLATSPPVRATLLFSHTHWDHIQGVPFFGPAYDPRSKLTFLGAGNRRRSLRESLDAQMRPPHFPVTLADFNAELEWGAVMPGEPIVVGPFTILPAEMSHPNGVLSYRIEAGGRAVVYATDVEHGDSLDHSLIALAEGADLLIHDAQYTASEYAGQAGPPRRGWGHSSWDQAVDIGVSAGVSRVALFHHDPNRLDGAVGEIEAQATDRFRGSFAAREGLQVSL